MTEVRMISYGNDGMLFGYLHRSSTTTLAVASVVPVISVVLD